MTDAKPAMSAFERRRLENMAANSALLKDITVTAKKIAPPSTTTSTTTTAKNRSAPSSRSQRSHQRSQAPRPSPSQSQSRTQVGRTTRQSARLAGVTVASEGVTGDLETGKRKWDDPSSASPSQQPSSDEKKKRLRVDGDQNLGDLLVQHHKYASGLPILGPAQPGQRTFYYDDTDADADDKDIQDEDDRDDRDDNSVRKVRRELGKLSLYGAWTPNEIKITPQRVYALAFHPTRDKPVIVAGDKDGTMGVFDASQHRGDDDTDDNDNDDDDAAPVIHAFQTHTRTISAIAFGEGDTPSSVYSASYDSSIRRVDLAAGVSTQVYAPPDPAHDQPISALDIPADAPHLVYFSTLHGTVHRYDMRVPLSSSSSSSTVCEWPLSHQKIGGFSLHPRLSHLLATASLDRTMKIWDLRKMVPIDDDDDDGDEAEVGGGGGEMPTLVAAHESRLSVSHASWSAGGHLATSSYDDTIKIFDLSAASEWRPGHKVRLHESTSLHANGHSTTKRSSKKLSTKKIKKEEEDSDDDDDDDNENNENNDDDKIDNNADNNDDDDPFTLAPAAAIAHNHQTGRWVTILKPHWQRAPRDGAEKLVIGNMNRFVDVFAADGTQLAQLDDGGTGAISAVPAACQMHPHWNWTAGGTASGKLCLWT